MNATNNTNDNDNGLGELFGEPISVYTRAQAIEDGQLVDVTEGIDGKDTPAQAGWKLPVALTSALWNRINNLPKSSFDSAGGRLWDVLHMSAMLASRAGAQDFFFPMTMPAKGDRKRKINIWVNIGGGDHGEPVITIGFPEDR
jgi:hypothetical protein